MKMSLIITLKGSGNAATGITAHEETCEHVGASSETTVAFNKSLTCY